MSGHVVTDLAERRGIDKKEAKERLFELFPYGYVAADVQDDRVIPAGRGWSTRLTHPVLQFRQKACRAGAGGLDCPLDILDGECPCPTN